MKFSALALDYDGTIALHGVLDPAVRRAIEDARRRGIAVILATGRRLEDLRRVAGDLTCFDVIVAENGGVLDFPASGRHVVLSEPPPESFMGELQRRSISVLQGESILEADSVWAPAILATIHATRQPSVLVFNRDRLMVLPQAVGKSTGLRQALLALRLSRHNTVAIGDAENDHDLLDYCEVGVAVEWGSPALRACADEVVPGTGPTDIAAYIHRIVAQPRLSPGQMGRRHILLGDEADGTPLRLAIRGRTILVAGEPATGKSWLTGLICEQVILQGYSVCIIDPEGDYRSLEALPSVMRFGGSHSLPPPQDLLRALDHPDISVLIDLAKVPQQEKREYLRAFLPMLSDFRRHTGLPHKIVLDEAHYFLGGPNDTHIIDPELAGYILATYRVSALPPSVCTERDNVVLVTGESDPNEARALLAMCSPSPSVSAPVDLFRDLTTSEAVLLPGAEEAHGTVHRFRLAPRLTSHVRHRAKYLDVPVPEDQAFVFTSAGYIGPRVRTLREFITLVSSFPADRIVGHLRRHDFSRWLNDVFRDHRLAEQVLAIERRVNTEHPGTVATAIGHAIRVRYDPAADQRTSRVRA